MYRMCVFAQRSSETPDGDSFQGNGPHVIPGWQNCPPFLKVDDGLMHDTCIGAGVYWQESGLNDLYVLVVIGPGGYNRPRHACVLARHQCTLISCVALKAASD